VKEHFASYLAHQGFVTLALAFFGVEGLPKTYTETPIRIEYFEEAVQFLRQHDSVDPEKIGVLGSSKGGDIAYAMMSHLPQIKAVCCMNGCIASMATQTIYKGEITEMIPADPASLKFIRDNIASILDCVNDPIDHPDSIHQIERSKADLLVIVSGRDANWPTERYAQLAKEKMDKVGKTNYQIIRYENMGHLIELPYLPICLYDKHPLVPLPGTMVFFGGEDKRKMSDDYIEVWRNVVQYFNKSFGMIEKTKPIVSKL